MIIDNLATLLKLIDFEEGDYYKFEESTQLWNKI